MLLWAIFFVSHAGEPQCKTRQLDILMVTIMSYKGTTKIERLNNWTCQTHRYPAIGHN